MSYNAIQVENLSKKYQIGARAGYKTFRESIVNTFTASFHKIRRLGEPALKKQMIWALKDVSFEVKEGEVIGIIGRNGAGKTTLLKILSRITRPTEGRVTIKGRVASLLEVGTGFHPELTGRENIYLNGAILGMLRDEINKKFDEIVAFSEIEKFIDTPVKHYSSGMYVRLAFAVAAHLEPEILMVDEVLAVGDAAFQKKCLGKMGDVARQGKTVLLISHNLGILREIAPKSIWLDAGKLVYKGDIEEAISRYISTGLLSEHTLVDLSDHPNRLIGMKSILRHISCRINQEEFSTDFSQKDTIIIELDYDASNSVKLAGSGIIITTFSGIRVGGFNTYMKYPPPHKIPPKGKIIFTMPARQFTPGSYLVTVSLGSHPGVLEDKVESAISFTIHPADIYGTGYLLTREDGVVALDVDVIISPCRGDK